MTSVRVWGPATRQRGLTLVEIMVALFVGLFLVAGIIQLYLGSRQTYRFEEALSRIQEKGRYAIDTIARDVRSAGFSGCTRLENLASDSSLPDPVYGVAQAPLSNDLRQQLNATANTDILTLRATDGIGVPIASNTTSDAITIAENPLAFKQGNSLAISDCSSFHQFTVAYVAGQPAVTTITPNPSLGKTFSSEVARLAFVAPFRDVTYFIRTGDSGNPGIWRRVLPNPAEELLDGVEDIEILFGQDTDGNGSPDVYRAASAVTDWRRILSLRVNLLLSSTDDNLAGEPQTLQWRGESLTPNDTRLRQVFTTTIALRNRLS